jgi:50S ribosomal subunit-associated GTPase HflX
MDIAKTAHLKAELAKIKDEYSALKRSYDQLVEYPETRGSEGERDIKGRLKAMEVRREEIKAEIEKIETETGRPTDPNMGFGRNR